MRKRNFVAQAIVFLGLHHLPVLGRIGTEAPGIEFTHGYVRRAMHHPACQFARQPRAPTDADLCAAATPIVPGTGRRPDHRVAVGRMADRAMHDALDPQFSQNGHPAQSIFQPWHHAFVIGLEQLVLRLPRAMVFPDRVRIFFLVDADQAGFLLHPDITGNKTVIPYHGQLGIQLLKFGYRVGDEIVVCH